MDDKDFTITYILDTILDSPSGHQPPTKDKKNMCSIAINGEEQITEKGALDELQIYQTQYGEYKIKISLSQSKIYHRKDI